MADRQETPDNALRPYRTVEDLRRAVRAVATHFDADEVFVIGSQAILAYANNPPKKTVTSLEIDIYLANTGDEVSEEINAFFGFGSQFEETHGFYIDGVDEGTAKLPPDWRNRAVVRTVDVRGRDVRMVAPGPEDLIVSKLARFEEKDRLWTSAYVGHYGYDADLVRKGVEALDLAPERVALIDAFLEKLD